MIEGALIHGLGKRAALEAKAIELLRDLSLPNPEQIGQRFPHQFRRPVAKGHGRYGADQRSVAGDPDEPTTALDVTTQIDVLRAFKRVVRERGATAVYVSHDPP